MNKQCLSALGLAQKAGKIVYGEKVLEMVRANQVYLVLVANDASANTKKKLLDKTKFYNVKCFEVVDSQTLSKAVGKIARMYLGITDANFAKMILNKLEEE